MFCQWGQGCWPLHQFGPHPIVAIIVVSAFVGVIGVAVAATIRSFIKWYRSGK